jgi:hypothetical protein
VFAFHSPGFAIGGAGAVVGFFQIAMGFGHIEQTPKGFVIWCRCERNAEHIALRDAVQITIFPRRCEADSLFAGH